MSATSLKHLALLLAVPLSIATATGLAAGPLGFDEPEDDHTRPDIYNEPTLPDELSPRPSLAEAEYPLATAFNAADSSNYTPGGMTSHDYVVVHTVQGSYVGCQSWFQNPAANVSAHFVARSSDGEITQMVWLSDRAWHVGSENAWSIGIEHEGWVDEPAWYTWEMYSGSGLLSRWLADRYSLPLDRDHIVAHSELPNQTHTDPGPNWDWDLYMALIRDIVSEGVVEGYVVDRSKACTITATADTWIKKTLQPSSELGDTDKCSIPAGTEISYLHASPDMVGHRRLTYEPGVGPCEGFIDLDGQGFAFAGHFTETCSDASMAAAGVTVVIDGGAQVVTDANGYFSFIEVGPGAHTLDVLGGGAFVDTVEPIDVDVYPGVRAIIAVDPVGGGDGDGDPGECWLGAEGCSCTDGGGCDPGLVCDEASHTCVPAEEPTGDGDGDTNGETSEGPGADGIDYLEGDNCSCTTDPDRREGVLGLLGLLALLGLARRRDDQSSWPG